MAEQSALSMTPSPIPSASAVQHHAPVISQLAPLDSYALHPTDHPRIVLVSQQLQEDNYASWSRSMHLALSSKHKLGFIDGSLKKPDPVTDPILTESWQCTNDIVST